MQTKKARTTDELTMVRSAFAKPQKQALRTIEEELQEK